MGALPEKAQKERTALLIIDMQEKFRSLIVDMRAVMAGCSRLIRFCDRLGIPTLVTEHYPTGLGPTVPELRHLFASFTALEKITFSCGDNAEFQAALDALQCDQVILCGIEAHVCVYQTAYDLLAQGRQVFAAADAISSRRRQDREIGLARMGRLGANLMSAEMIMFEILRRAKTADFQAVADILKE